MHAEYFSGLSRALMESSRFEVAYEASHRGILQRPGRWQYQFLSGMDLDVDKPRLLDRGLERGRHGTRAH